MNRTTLSLRTPLGVNRVRVGEIILHNNIAVDDPLPVRGILPCSRKFLNKRYHILRSKNTISFRIGSTQTRYFRLNEIGNTQHRITFRRQGNRNASKSQQDGSTCHKNKQSRKRFATTAVVTRASAFHGEEVICTMVRSLAMGAMTHFTP